MKKLISLAALCTIIFVSFSFRKKVPSFTLKKFEKRMGLVKPGLYASKYETTNFEYNEFLKFLENKNDEKKVETARIFNENWLMKNTHMEPLKENYHVHPAYFEYPVVNVSHEGAQLFCDWLTEQYNQYPNREFKKVKFRLPSEEEWEVAAMGGREMAIYPWGGYYLRNAKGQILANYRRVDESNLKVNKETGEVEILDRKINQSTNFAAPAASFLPNDFGLHHLSGNVAEMLNVPGRTKGGSWFSSGYYIRIDAEDEYVGWTKPSPMIGFRYFMEVIEE